MSYGWGHWHPSPGEQEDLADESPKRAFIVDERRLGAAVFPDIRGQVRVKLIHGGYRTREQVAKATDGELLLNVHQRLSGAGPLEGNGLAAIRAVIPCSGGEEPINWRARAEAAEAELATLRERVKALEEELRPEVRAFALLMEERLRANDHKGGWKQCVGSWLLGRLIEEVGELREEMLVADTTGAHCVGDEAADVANFAMMIADVAHDLDAALARLDAREDARREEAQP